MHRIDDQSIQFSTVKSYPYKTAVFTCENVSQRKNQRRSSLVFGTHMWPSPSVPLFWETYSFARLSFCASEKRRKKRNDKYRRRSYNWRNATHEPMEELLREREDYLMKRMLEEKPDCFTMVFSPEEEGRSHSTFGLTLS